MAEEKQENVKKEGSESEKLMDEILNAKAAYESAEREKERERNVRFRAAYEYLMTYKYAGSQLECARIMKSSQPVISSAYHNRPGALSEQLMQRFAVAFPMLNPDYVMNGVPPVNNEAWTQDDDEQWFINLQKIKHDIAAERSRAAGTDESPSTNALSKQLTVLQDLNDKYSEKITGLNELNTQLTERVASLQEQNKLLRELNEQRTAEVGRLTAQIELLSDLLRAGHGVK